jgi:hypothetical protein
MMSLEQSILDAVRALPAEMQHELLTHAEKLRAAAMQAQPRQSGKGLWANLPLTLTETEIDENQREMWKNFPHNGI